GKHWPVISINSPELPEFCENRSLPAMFAQFADRPLGHSHVARVLGGVRVPARSDFGSTSGLLAFRLVMGGIPQVHHIREIGRHRWLQARDADSKGAMEFGPVDPAGVDRERGGIAADMGNRNTVW